MNSQKPPEVTLAEYHLSKAPYDFEKMSNIVDALEFLTRESLATRCPMFHTTVKNVFTMCHSLYTIELRAHQPSVPDA